MKSETMILMKGYIMFLKRSTLQIITMVLGVVILQQGMTELSTISFVHR